MDEAKDWFFIYLKLDEAEFFLDQIRSHQKIPRLLLFYLSAFLSSARSVTFHIQNQMVSCAPDGRAIYDETIDELLSDDVSKFFVALRNTSEKQLYLPLVFRLLESSFAEGEPRSVLTQRAQYTPPASPSRKDFAWLEELLQNTADWPSASSIKPQWYITNFPGGEKELTAACASYLAKLRGFVGELRQRLRSRTH